MHVKMTNNFLQCIYIYLCVRERETGRVRQRRCTAKSHLETEKGHIKINQSNNKGQAKMHENILVE